MKHSWKIRVALRLARKIGSCARTLRRQLRDHSRNESFRIRRAEKRARGLRLYAAWSRRPAAPVSSRALVASWHPAQSVA